MARRHKITDLSQVIPERIRGFENIFTESGLLKAVTTLNGLIGSIILVDTEGNAVSVNTTTGQITVGNATQIQGVDVSDTAPTNGQVLTYNATSEKWEPATP